MNFKIILENLSKTFTYIFIFITSLLFNGSTLPDEGMYPLSEISKLNLKNAGLKIDIKEIYNPNGVSIVDALVKVGGCTGSFVSDEGLILTNHHCAYDIIAKASSVENNYLEKGFYAKSKEDEFPAKNFTCLITESYEDVSEIIINSANQVKDISERIKAIQKKGREITDSIEKKDSSIKAEVSEMFIGKTYFLFKYKIIKDVRLVFAPPRSIGEFGGETDNWVWPRHTGDFSFLRAYVAPDGKPASYSINNIPYKPKRFLKVNPNGIDEGDFIFILGYPGRTFRHQPSQFIEFQEKYQLPFISDLYEHLIKEFKILCKNNAELDIKLSPRIKGLANTEKNYKGKIQGLRRIDLVKKKQEEEKELQKFINSNDELKNQYGNLLSEISTIYQTNFELGRTFLFYNQISTSTIMRIVEIIIDYQTENNKPEQERKSAYTTANLPALFERVKTLFKEWNKETDKILLTKLLDDVKVYGELQKLKSLERFLIKDESANKNFLDLLFAKTILKDFNSFNNLLTKSELEIKQTNDELLNLLIELKSNISPLIKENEARNSKLNKLIAQYNEVKKIWQNKTFIPDANSTLRLTYGYIKGYSPADATYMNPVTTLKGVIEKSFLGSDFKIPEKLKELYNKKDFGKFKNKKLDDISVALLYNSDTSGGNSGSPIMNSYGELIGVNFDRTFEATINDFAWNNDYSRSIGVDIRYVLWVTQKIGNADKLIKELRIE